MSDVKLHDTMDAKIWTDEFIRINDGKVIGVDFDFGSALGWMANSIMAGFDEANRRSENKIQQLEQALESIAAHSPSERDREIALKALGRETEWPSKK